MNLQAGLVRREEMLELQRVLSDHVNQNDALKKKIIELEEDVKDHIDWQEELTQNAIEAEKDFNVKQRLWTEENSSLQKRNRALAAERDRKDKEVSDAKDQLDLAQQAAKNSESQLNQITMAYRELKVMHEGLPERYEAAKLAAKESSDGAASKESVILGLEAQLAAKQAELDALSASSESRIAQLQKEIESERQQQQQTMGDAHRRWEERLARVQGDKVIAEANAEQIKGEMKELQGRFDLMQGDVQLRDGRASTQLQKLEADVTREKEQVAQLQSALKESQAQVEQQQAIATQATAAMKAAQSTAAAAAEVVKQEQETGAQCTEEAMRAMTAVDVQLQEAKEKEADLVRREKQVEAKEALVSQELNQREQALDGQLKAVEESAAARVSFAEQQGSAANAALEQERTDRSKAIAEVQAQHEEALALIRQRESDLQEQITALKQQLDDSAAGNQNEMEVDAATNGDGRRTRAGRISSMQDKETKLQKSVKELEERYAKLSEEVANAASAREELAQLRKNVRDASSQKGDLQNLVRELQKEELSLRTKITTANNNLLAGSGSKNDSAPVAFGSPRGNHVPFGSPAMPAVHVSAAPVSEIQPAEPAATPHTVLSSLTTDEQSWLASPPDGLLSSPCDGLVTKKTASPSAADNAQNPGVTPPSTGGILGGGFLSRVTGMFAGPTVRLSGYTPSLLADDTADRIESGGSPADEQGLSTEVELAPPGWQQTGNTPRFGQARVSTNAAAKQRRMQASAAVPGAANKIRSAKVSPEGTARLAARAKAAADEAAETAVPTGPTTRRAGGSGTGSGGGEPASKHGALGSSSLPKRPLSGSKRRRNDKESSPDAPEVDPAAEPAAADVPDADVEFPEAADVDAVVDVDGDGEPAAAAVQEEIAAERTRRIERAIAGRTTSAGAGPSGAKKSVKTSIARAPTVLKGTGAAAQNADAQKADAGVEAARKRVAQKAKKDAAVAAPAASGRTSARKATAAATPVGAADTGANQQVTPPKIWGGAGGTRAGSAVTQNCRRKRAVGGGTGDDTKSGTTSGAKSGLSGAALRKTTSQEPAAKKRATAAARDGNNGAGTSAAGAAAGAKGTAAEGGKTAARGRARVPIMIDTSPEPENSADSGAVGAAEGDGEEDANASTPHGMSTRVQHLVEEAVAYTGYSTAELLNDDGQPLSARAARAASRAQSRSTMTPGKGVEDGEEAEGGAARSGTPQQKPKSRWGVPKTRGRNLQDIVEDEDEHSDKEQVE